MTSSIFCIAQTLLFYSHLEVDLSLKFGNYKVQQNVKLGDIIVPPVALFHLFFIHALSEGLGVGGLVSQNPH